MVRCCIAFYSLLVVSGIGAGSHSPKVEPFELVKAGSLNLSRKGVDLIVRHETGGKYYYNSRLRGAVWPGGASGVTIGFGFDLGYNSKNQIRAAWEGIATPAELNVFLSCAGVKGSRAKALAKRYRGMVDISWEEAQGVFMRDSMTRFTKLTATAFKISRDKLHPHINSAITSVVFNRGARMSGHSRRHMRELRDAITAGHIDHIPGIIRSMKVIWIGKGLDGLLRRREDEAALAELALPPP